MRLGISDARASALFEERELRRIPFVRYGATPRRFRTRATEASVLNTLYRRESGLCDRLSEPEQSKDHDSQTLVSLGRAGASWAFRVFLGRRPALREIRRLQKFMAARDSSSASLNGCGQLPWPTLPSTSVARRDYNTYWIPL